MKKILINTNSRDEMIEITGKIEESIDISEGVLYLYVPHTTCAITINEAYDPDVAEDVLKKLDEVIPWYSNYRHLEGNSAAHIKSILVGNSATIFVENGTLLLGRWQGIFLTEFDGPRQREIWVKTIKG